MLSYHVECLFYIYWNRTFWIKQTFITVLCICKCYEINWLSYTITSYSECNFSESLLTSVTETCLLITMAPLASSKAFLKRRLYHCLLLNDSRKLGTNMFDTLTTTVLPDRNRSNQPLASLSCVSSIPRFWQFLPPSLQHWVWQAILLHVSQWQNVVQLYLWVSSLLRAYKAFCCCFTRKYGIAVIPLVTDICFATIKCMPHCSASMLVYIHFISVLNHSEIF